MACEDVYDGGTDLTGLVKQFSATYTMYGDFSASATLSNPGCVLSIDTTTDSCIPIYANLDFTALGLSDVISAGDLADCYQSSPKWIAGLLTSFGEVQSGSASDVDISMESYHTRLNSLPITSYQFTSNSLSALQQVITYFAGIPSDLYNLNVTLNPIWGSLDGGSVMDGIRTLAQLSQSTAYVQVGGVLEVHKWKDHNSPIELSIPKALIGPVAKRASNLIPKLAVQARGASFSVDGCGERIVSDSRTSDTEGGISNNPGPAKFTTLSGIDTEEVKSVMANLNAERKALQDMQFLNGANVTIDKVQGDDGNVRFVIRPAAGVIGKDGIEVDLAAIAAWKRNNPQIKEKVFRGIKADLARLKRDQLDTQQVLARAFADEVDYFPSAAKGGPAGGPGSKVLSNSNWANNQSNNTQLDVFAFNNNVGAACGASYEQIDNPMCNSRDLLFKIAVRRHQEMLMDNNTFNITLNGFIPCLRLNQVIQFETPGTRDCPSRWVKGLVTEINAEYDPQTQSKMTISVADLDVLGQTTYTSSNLLDWQCGGGANSIASNPWEASVLSINSTSTVQDGVVTLFANNGAGLTYAYLNQYLTQGEQYTLSFQYQRFFGSAPVFFNNTAGGGATLLGPIGTYTENFTAALATPQLQWSMLNPSTRSLWKIFNIRLTRTVIA
jgi:hypothetical protein